MSHVPSRYRYILLIIITLRVTHGPQAGGQEYVYIRTLYIYDILCSSPFAEPSESDLIFTKHNRPVSSNF